MFLNKILRNLKNGHPLSYMGLGASIGVVGYLWWLEYKRPKTTLSDPIEAAWENDTKIIDKALFI